MLKHISYYAHEQNRKTMAGGGRNVFEMTVWTAEPAKSQFITEIPKTTAKSGSDPNFDLPLAFRLVPHLQGLSPDVLDGFSGLV